ncbi:MAG TPA: substrate-binding domain-containing protein [Dehalococcoidia bacterium]|nr:substrate-binding domain-containing protein [Dehalococcoidia bacterium]
MRRMIALAPAILLALLITSLACSSKDELILATTTSTQDSGLLDVLVPMFEKDYGYKVKTIAVGSGQALEMGAKGEADVILSHSPKAEEDFMAAGNGESREAVIHNDFVIVGPAGDPAGIKGGSAADAFTKIAGSDSHFLSRGDQSGTNTKELSIWTATKIDPAGKSWYEETGQGMGATLNVTSEKGGYTLTDRGTFLAQKANLDLVILVEGDKTLFNNYHVIVVNPANHSKVNVKGARDFASFILSASTQDLIRNFGMDKFGQALFVPDAFVQGATASPKP